MAKAYLISPETQTIEPIEITDPAQIAERIGYSTLETDTVGELGDRLYFDEECFIRGATGRFQIDRLIPVAGKGIVIGVGDDGGLADVRIAPDDLAARTRFE
jgi:hypothetical protein